MPKWSTIVALMLVPWLAWGDQSAPPSTPPPPKTAPQIQPWHKPVYPESRAAFLEGFKQAGYAMVCGVKETRECLGFTGDCLTEISAHTDQCASDKSVPVPESFATADETKPVNKALFACVAEKQRLSGKGQISVEACNRLEQLRQQSAAPHK